MFRNIIILLFIIFLSAQSFADQNDKRLNRIFDKLIVTEDQLEIEKLTQQIWKIWHEIDDPKMTRAFETGVQMMNLGFHSRAIDYFDKVITQMPNFAVFSIFKARYLRKYKTYYHESFCQTRLLSSFTSK